MNDLNHPEHRRTTLEAIHDSAVDAIITIDHRGMIETINPATVKLFGYTAEELIGHNVKLLMPEPYRAEHDGYLQDYLSSGEAKIIGIGREVVARTKNGVEFPVHLAVSEVRLDGRVVFAGFIRDLTAFNMTEQQKVTFGRIIEESLNEIYIFDANTLNYVDVNRGARENLGYSLHELQGLTPLDIQPNFERSQFDKLLEPLKCEKQKQTYSTVHRRKDGSRYDVEVHLQLTTYLAQPVIVAIVLNITERLSAERQIRLQQETMQQELERLVDERTHELREAQAEIVRNEKYSTLGKVSGGIAHEIRNPLNSVKTSAYYLLNAKHPSPEKVREHLERIDRQVTMIDNVITALSDVARMPEANMQPLAMRPILRSVVSSTHLPANIKTEFHFPDELPNVLGDEHQIIIAFRNLIRNARDAMIEGGTMTIAAKINGNSVVFSVSDNGVGIAEQDLENILEPLFTTKARGMGLGLAITRAIVEKNQGLLSVQSELECGSTFSISLKIAA